jgi:hypothetical protein
MPMTITLPDDLAESLKAAAERKHIDAAVLACQGIRMVVDEVRKKEEEKNTPFPPRKKTVHLMLGLGKTDGPPLTDEDIARIKDERIMRKYGYGLDDLKK